VSEGIKEGGGCAMFLRGFYNVVERMEGVSDKDGE
jgi:hypothetical protein